MLRVQGDSMVEAAILDGDLILVRPQRTAENGEIVVAMLDGEATVKRFYREPARDPVAAGESSDGANLRERCRDRRSRRSRRPPALKPFSPSRRGRCRSCAASESFRSSLRFATALPWSFIGLAAAFVAILALQLRSGAPQSASLGLRVASALLPAFGVMSAALVVVLPLRFARAARYGAPAVACGKHRRLRAGAAPAVRARSGRVSTVSRRLRDSSSRF